MFANLPYERKKKVKPIIIKTTRVQKKQPKVTGKNWKDINSTIETETILGPKETKRGTIELAETKQTYRINESTFIDPQTKDQVRVAEVEEASRYTPAELQYEYEDLGEGITKVNAIKGDRIVSATATTVTAPQERNEKIFYLEAKFKKWEQDPTKENRLSTNELKLLGKELGVKVGGGKPSKGAKKQNVQTKLEGRIKKKFIELKEEQKRLLDTRYRTFPQRTKSKITKSKGMKYENEDVINQILATEMASERMLKPNPNTIPKTDLYKKADKIELNPNIQKND